MSYKAFIITIYFIRPNKIRFFVLLKKAHAQYIPIDRSYERSTVDDCQYVAELAAAFPPLS